MIRVVMAVREHKVNKKGNAYSIGDVSAPAARLIGVLTLTLLSLLQMFRPRLGRSFNFFPAMIKLTFLVILLGFSISAARKNDDVWKDWDAKADTHSQNGWAKALLAVIFSFQG
jgi:amino acid transporter